MFWNENCRLAECGGGVGGGPMLAVSLGAGSSTGSRPREPPNWTRRAELEPLAVLPTRGLLGPRLLYAPSGAMYEVGSSPNFCTGTEISVSCTGCIGLRVLDGSGVAWKSGWPGSSTLRARLRIVPTMLERAGDAGLSASASSSGVGKCDQPNGGCGVAGVYGAGEVIDRPLWLPNMVFLRRRPSHSY